MKSGEALDSDLQNVEMTERGKEVFANEGCSARSVTGGSGIFTNCSFLF